MGACHLSSGMQGRGCYRPSLIAQQQTSRSETEHTPVCYATDGSWIIIQDSGSTLPWQASKTPESHVLLLCDAVHAYQTPYRNVWLDIASTCPDLPGPLHGKLRYSWVRSQVLEIQTQVLGWSPRSVRDYFHQTSIITRMFGYILPWEFVTV